MVGSKWIGQVGKWLELERLSRRSPASFKPFSKNTIRDGGSTLLNTAIFEYMRCFHETMKASVADLSSLDHFYVECAIYLRYSESPRNFKGKLEEEKDAHALISLFGHFQ